MAFKVDDVEVISDAGEVPFDAVKNVPLGITGIVATVSNCATASGAGLAIVPTYSAVDATVTLAYTLANGNCNCNCDCNCACNCS